MRMVRPTCAIYQLDNNRRYLLPTIAPEAAIIIAHLPDSSTRVLESIPNETSKFVFHLDLTIAASTPTDRGTLVCELDKFGLCAWNARVTDISKRNVQAVLANHGLNSTSIVPDSDYDGMVIVKNNGNFGAVTERAMSRELRKQLRIDDVCTTSLAANEYYICKRAEVPDEMWLRRDISIERYISNTEDAFYRFYVCGSALVLSRVYDPAPLKKMPPGIARKNVYFWQHERSTNVIAAGFDRYEGIAKEAIAARLSFNLDFGALDVVCNCDEEAFVIDVNSTPFWGATGCREIIEFLRRGIEA